MDIFNGKMLDLSFPYYDISDIQLDYRIGSGSIGDVYKGTLTLDEDTADCVVKKVSSDTYEKGSIDSPLYQDMLDEIIIGEKLIGKTKYQIQFYGYSIFERSGIVTIYLIMEKTDAVGDLATYISNNKYWLSLTKEEYRNSESNTILYQDGSYWDFILPEKEKVTIMYQMCLAVQELHSFSIIHCDLKPGNMLFDTKTIKLIDYNASQDIDNKLDIQGPTELGTPGYIATEMYKGCISYKTDIYSLGVCMLEIWFGDIWCKQVDSYSKNRTYILTYLTNLKKDNLKLYTLIKKCILVNPIKRPTLTYIISNLDHIQGLQNIPR
jgi:serine/threonine protein kinase